MILSVLLALLIQPAVPQCGDVCFDPPNVTAVAEQYAIRIDSQIGLCIPSPFGIDGCNGVEIRFDLVTSSGPVNGTCTYKVYDPAATPGCICVRATLGDSNSTCCFRNDSGFVTFDCPPDETTPLYSAPTSASEQGLSSPFSTYFSTYSTMTSTTEGGSKLKWLPALVVPVGAFCLLFGTVLMMIILAPAPFVWVSMQLCRRRPQWIKRIKTWYPVHKRDRNNKQVHTPEITV